MQIKVFINRREAVLNLKEDARVRDALEALGLEENENLVLKDGALLPLDDTIKEGDVLEVLRVVTGG